MWKVPWPGLKGLWVTWNGTRVEGGLRVMRNGTRVE